MNLYTEWAVYEIDQYLLHNCYVLFTLDKWTLFTDGLVNGRKTEKLRSDKNYNSCVTNTDKVILKQQMTNYYKYEPLKVLYPTILQRLQCKSRI